MAKDVADIGLSVMIWLCGAQCRRVEVLQYQTFGSTRLVLAIPEKSPVRSLVDLNGLRVATEFPGICQRFFADTGVDVTQIEVSGTCKAAPQLGVAGAIVDLTSPWVMLEINKLRVV